MKSNSGNDQNEGNRRAKKYDLEERTFIFTKQVRLFIRHTPKTLTTGEDIRQLTRASGSVGANYIEANESLSKKDFLLRIKICRKEAKESRYWLQLLETGPEAEIEKLRLELIQEATELTSIFGASQEKRISQRFGLIV